MPIHRGSFGGAVNLLPTVTIDATTGVTESRAVFNATVNGNLANTTVVFHYSTASNFSSFTSVAGSGSGTGSFASSATVTGLPINDSGQLYYVRAVVTSSIGSVTSGSTSFTTWRKLTYSNSTPGLYSFTVPTVAGVTPAALPVFVIIGGGGGGAFSGGGGGAGGLRSTTTHSSAFTGTSGVLNIGIGSGGGAGDNSGTASSNGGNGLSTTLSGTNFPSYTAGGGEGGIHQGRGGNLGSGEGVARTGGSFYTDGAKIATTRAGGGAGMDANGGNGSLAAAGNGGNGNGVWGNSGGGGGSTNSNANGSHGNPNNYGAGGNGGFGLTGIQAGSGGLVFFYYYGP